MVKLFDSHAHLDDKKFDVDRESVIQECITELDGVINPGCDLPTSSAAVELASKYANIYAAVGFHPHEAQHMKDKDEEILSKWAKDEKVVAIGEIGLDYYYDHSPREVQKAVFIRQLDLARQLNLPIIIHNRDAHGDLLQIIKNEGKGIKGVFHCYSGSWEMAKEILKMGYYVSFGGSLTFKNAVKTVEVAQKVPLDRVLLETDSPYLTPEPFRGKRNNPCMVKYVAERLVKERGIDFAQISSITTQNVYDLFEKMTKK